MESSLPSSSPISYTDVPSDGTEHVVPKTQSNDSASMWSAVGSLPRSPATFQFDEYESRAFEDGELLDEGPPSNQLADGEEKRAFLEELDEYAGEQYEHHPRIPAPTHRKRSWEGSQGSEELNRTARRQRRDFAGPVQPSLRLPSMNEILANPWGGAGSVDDMRRDMSHPVACSTPKHVSEYATHSHRTLNPPYTMDSQANVSGHPPTPFSRANTTIESVYSRRRNADRVDETGSSRSPNQPERDGCDSMRIDERDENRDGNDDGDGDESALLRAPPGRNTMRSRSSAYSLGQILETSPPRGGASGRRAESGEWRVGYAPRHWDSTIPGRSGVQRVPAADGWNAGGDGNANDATFSPIPHTKAWQYQQAMRRNHETRSREDEPRERRAYAAQSERGRRMAGLETRTNMTPVRETTTQARASQASQRHTEYDGTGWNDEGLDETQMDTREDWGAFEIVPTAVAQSPHAADLPTLAENPRDSKWEVHFDDPECLLRGQSADWQREVWKDSTAVMFTAYNYKHTTNGVVNRHVESAVSAITTYVTGETHFSVVPPDPDRERQLAVRDLPFTWAIRGLTANGASRMAAVRVASSKGVSIITYPRRLSNPRWVCGLVGFLRPDAAVIRAAVMDVLRTPEMYEWLTRLTRASMTLRRIPAEERVEYVLSTLDVKIADLDDGDFTANVFIDSPTDDMSEWRNWVASLRSRKYNNFLNGTGVARRVYWCSGCRGVDHDTMRCLFPSMRGWQGTGLGARSHTAEVLGTRKSIAFERQDGAQRGGGTWKGRARENREWTDGAGYYDGEGGGMYRRSEGRRPHTPRGRSPWNGGGRQPQRRFATQQRTDVPPRGWYD